MKHLKSLLLTGCLLIAVCHLPAAASTSPPLPLDSWVYPALDKLGGMGMVSSELQGTRPYTRLEAARQVAEARSRIATGTTPPAVCRLIRRLEREFWEHLVELGTVEGTSPESYFKPLRSLELSYLHHDAEDSRFPGTDARQSALNYNNFGIDYADGNNGQLTFQTEGRLADRFLLYARPILELQEDRTTDFRLLEGKAALGLGPLELSVGRQSLWWGQGRHGALVLTNNAKPLDMLRVTNPAPILLPWFLKYLGPFRFDAFWSRLEEDRTVPQPYFAGLRMNIKPLPWFELGGSRAVMFGGEGRPDVDFENFITILGGKNLSGDEDLSNSVAALDARIRLPFLYGAELYGELGGEDEAGGFIANKAYLVGIFMPRLDPGARISLRLEYADLSEIDDNSPPWYRHGIYRSGYVYRGQILGHHVGGAAKDFSAEICVLLPRDATLSFKLDLEKRGYDQPAKEKHLQPAVEMDWPLRPNLALALGYSSDRVENFHFVEGSDRTFHLGEIGVQGTW